MRKFIENYPWTSGGIVGIILGLLIGGIVLVLLR